MASQVRLKSVIWLTLVALALVLAACASPAQATWNEVQYHTGVTTDAKGDVLIVGGSVSGPSGSGGQAEWTIPAEAGRVNELSLTILTNGQRLRGKGIHSTRPNGTVDIYVNDVLVHTIVCDTQGAYGDFWPHQAPVGSSGYDTGTIDVSSQEINGPNLTLKIVASPYTALDINGIEIAVTTEGV